MVTKLKDITDEYQPLGQRGMDAAFRSYGEAGNGFQTFAAEVTDYSKRAFNDCLRAWEQMLAAKSFDQALQIQSQFLQGAFNAHVAEMAKLSEMSTKMVRTAYAPVEQRLTDKAN